jgi:hypothetical protein
MGQDRKVLGGEFEKVNSSAIASDFARKFL